MAEINTKVLSGFMELLPHEQLEFDRIKSIILATYQQFGYTPLDTPVIERSEVLLAKGSQETDKQVYFVQNGLVSDKADALAMRFDLTIPLARYVAQHFNELAFPFKRCHIGKAYRGERAQKGRFREFYQCDIDVIGKDALSIHYDAELPAIIYQLFKNLDFGKFTIRINNRKIFNGLFAHLKLADKKADILRLIDKAEKIGHDKFLDELSKFDLSEGQLSKLLKFLAIKGDASAVLSTLGILMDELSIDSNAFAEGLDELAAVVDTMLKMGVNPDYFTIDLSIVRGLDYYTGTVYETTLDNYDIGSICSGGRYDNLAGHYSSQKLPGVGISIGLTRLFWQLMDAGIISPASKTVAKLLILPQSIGNVDAAISAASSLRACGHNVDVFLEDINMKKKLQYAARIDAPYVIVARDNGLSLQYKRDDEIIKEMLTVDEIISKI